MPPVRKVSIRLDEGVIVVGLDQVGELVHDQILDAAERTLGESEVAQD